MEKDDFIRRKAAILIVQRYGVGCLDPDEFTPEQAERFVIARLQAMPAADVRPVVRGKWIDRDDKYYGWNMWACSACGEEFVLTEGTPDMNEYHFCPNCGAMMEES